MPKHVYDFEVKYKDDPKGYLKLYFKQPWHCEVCNKTITMMRKSTHLKTKYHQKRVTLSHNSETFF